MTLHPSIARLISPLKARPGRTSRGAIQHLILARSRAAQIASAAGLSLEEWEMKTSCAMGARPFYEIGRPQVKAGCSPVLATGRRTSRAPEAIRSSSESGDTEGRVQFQDSSVAFVDDNISRPCREEKKSCLHYEMVRNNAVTGGALP
jgi:hypothetical protein